MILSYEELKNWEKKVAMVDGGFDPLHEGHLKYFEEASRLGLPVLCNVQSDRYINDAKKRPNLLPEEQRIRLIDSLKTISYVHLCKTSTHEVLRQLQPLKYVKGWDWKKRGLPEIEQKICREVGIEIVYLDTVLDSSTNIAARFTQNLGSHVGCERVDDFESLLFSQQEVKSGHYDEHYFKDGWRNCGNDYSIEKRRVIEAKNPFNIKEVFNPTRVLDIGCGPGALMYFLHELGIETYGIDFSKAAKEMAPPEIKSHIVVAPVTEFYDFKIDFDLVICRELLEHLTVLQIRKAVKVLADYTSKYLYLTTRFHPAPKGLLDVTDDKGTDPTHITLLNKEFLKVLFMLEGLKPRPDLEAKMDWKKFGRVLVFGK